MSDLISREAAIAAVCEHGLVNAIRTIRALPATPVPDVAGAARVLVANMPPIGHPAWDALMQACEDGKDDEDCMEAWLRQIAGGDNNG